MKKYNIENYVRYKNELLDKINKNKKYLVKDSNGNTMYHLLTPEQTIIQFMPLVENIARIAGLLDCSTRTIHRNMCSELKREKELLNQQL